MAADAVPPTADQASVRPRTDEGDGAGLPTGTVTFLFTDIEGSTKLLRDLGPRYGTVLAEHRSLIADAASANDGRVFGTEGDAMFLVFSDAPSAVTAAVGAQRALARHPWPDGFDVRVRMGIHTGDAQLTAGGYVGLSLHEIARIAAAGHGGQVLLSSATRGLLQDLPSGLLLRDLGDHRLKDLTRPERLFELVIADLDRSFPPVRSLEARPNNLPEQLTSFIGRRELETARALLRGTRLLTLTGPGGTGKTRLALQLAALAVDDFADGAFFVPLDAVLDSDLVASTIADTLRLPPGTDQPIDRLVAHLRDRRMLLILDNFEQVVDAAPIVARLLRDAPHIALLVTSRIVLRISGEQEYVVPPLGLPESADVRTARDAARSEAIMLFVERAMAVQPSFTLRDEHAAALADIVMRLDGLPLAIELAAARVRVLPVEAIRARLQDRLSLLTGGARDLPARQQTLRGAIDWSYDLLDEADRLLFTRFAIFSGGACLTQAETVCGPAADLGHDVLDGLGSLVEKSLVRSVPEAEVEPRFAMLATIREYGLERAAALPDAAQLHRRHARAYLALAEEAAPSLTGSDGRRWLDRLQLDHDNLRAALDWAVANDDAELALRLIAALWRFWQIRGHLHEAAQRSEAALALPSTAGQPPELRSRAHGAAGGIWYWRGDFPRMREHYRAALDEARRSTDRSVLAEALYDFSFTPDLDDPDSVDVAKPYIEESLAIYLELGDRRGAANASWGAGTGNLMRKRWDPAKHYLAEALDGYRAVGDDFGMGWALHELGLIEILTDRPAAALPFIREALEVFARTSDLSAIELLLGDFAEVARRADRLDRYWRLAGAADHLREQTGVELDVVSADALGMMIPSAAPADDEAARRAFIEGRNLSVGDAIAYALEADGAG